MRRRAGDERWPCQAAIRVRRRLAEELGTDPGPPLRELYQQILTADSHALDYYAQALALHRDLGNTYRQPDALAGLAAAHAARGDHDEARRAWRQARELYLAQHRGLEAVGIQQRLDALR